MERMKMLLLQLDNVEPRHLDKSESLACQAYNFQQALHCLTAKLQSYFETLGQY